MFKYREVNSLLSGRDVDMNDDEIKEFLSDFKKANEQTKLDMWYYALEQDALWDEILTELSTIAQGQGAKTVEEE